MIRSSAIILLTISSFWSCVPKQEAEKLQMENEELKAELTRAQTAATTLEEVGALLDSIDKERNALQLDLEAGTKYEDYIKRMNELNEYVRSTEEKIDQLEKELNKSAANSQAYLKTISRLKRELAKKSQRIAKLEEVVEQYKKENTVLLDAVSEQEMQLADLEDQISMKQEELAVLEDNIREVMEKAQINEANSYYALGNALSEAAKRTKMAPKKRKETYMQALENYRKALAFGHEEAQAKINELEKKLKIKKTEAAVETETETESETEN